ncbi:MAG: PAS domain-containing protein, partial [Gammaproteobacteria bacterium]|nr:PAS domain-containing protein [Gammaproteobacteria bacterium]
ANMALMANLALAVFGIALTLLLGWVLARNILHQLGGEPSYIAEIADHIAHGELDTPLRDERGGRRSGIYASIVSMRDNLRERINADRKAAEETQRIKTALDCVSTNVMVADEGFNIIYANKAVQAMFREAETDLRERLPAFDANALLGNNIDQFHANPAHQRGLLEKLQDTYQSEVTVGPRTFRIIANPVVDSDGHRLGTAVEWTDRTAELRAAEEEASRLEEERRHAGENLRIKTALDHASSCVMMADTDLNVIYLNEAARRMFDEVKGDFRRVLTGFDGNALVGRPVAQLYTDGIGQAQLLGSLEQRNEAEVVYGGRTMKVVANPVVNARHDKLGYAIEWTDRTDEVAVENEVSAIVAAASRGNLQERIDLQGKHGFFSRLSEGVNQLIDVVDTSFGDIAAAMQRLSQGDLTETITRDYEGTFGQVKESVNGTVAKLDELVASLRESSDTVSTAAGEIASGNNNLSQRTEQNAASLEETAASVEQLAATVRNNADNAQQANQVAHRAREQAQLGGEVVGRAIEAMREINASSSKIAEIIGVIDEIAFQTNLLALNASVEAARAGEQGRGFAVVATEVRNLAGRSATAAKEIKELINDSVNKVHSGSDLVNDSGGKLEEIVVSVKKVADIVAEISAASAEQSSGIDQINQAVTSMDEGTQQNAALAEQTSAAATALDDRAREMQSLIAFFRTRGGSRPAADATSKKPAPSPAPAARPTARPAAVAPSRAKAPSPPVAQLDDDDDWETF